MSSDTTLAQSQAQNLVISVQLQESLKILQLGQLDLRSAIEKELLENPFLEEVSVDRTCEAEKIIPQIRDNAARDYTAQKGEYQHEYVDRGPGTDQPEYLHRAPDPTLTEHLLWQLRFLDATREEKTLVAYLIRNVNDDGYLEVGDEEIAQETDASAVEIRKALALLQSLEPHGVGARTVEECILIQLEAYGKSEMLEGELVRKYSSAHKIDLKRIALNEGVSIERIREALAFIRSLELAPGRIASPEVTMIAVPDVTVRKAGEDYCVSINDNDLPDIQVSSLYKDFLQKRSDLNSETRRYVKSKVKSVSWFLKCIRQRHGTLLKVVTSIVKHERDFLEKGIEFLKPLTLKDIATDVDLHESTVSRALANKYIETPRGVFELKFFLTPRIKTKKGEISVSTIKERIQKIIAHEPPPRPVTDREITAILKEKEIVIARRTVAKYREALGIPNWDMRRQHYSLTRTDS